MGVILSQLEVLRTEHARFSRFGPLVVERSRFTPGLLLALIARIAFAISVIWHVGVDPLRAELFEIVFTMIPRSGGDDRCVCPERLHGLHHGHSQFLLLPNSV